ncbi:MAG: hypothetical protein IPK68_06305 [Bdellovibrionales bacterium]|nr:hypothetical protein [Bdellovibrionales bacterium]
MSSLLTDTVRTAISLLFITGASNSCVSIDISKTNQVRDNNIKFHAPDLPYQVAPLASVDGAWRNTETGDSISYISECDSSTDPSLDSIHKGILQGIENLKIVSSEYKKYNSRQALFTTVNGELDGIGTQMQFVIFKKNQCIYVLTNISYMKGAHPKGATSSRDFQMFLEKFEVP